MHLRKKNSSGSFIAIAWRRLQDADGSQLVELAIALPVLLLFLVGIISFGGAFELRNKLAIAAREGARLAASESTLDLYAGGTPPSIQAIRDVVYNSLANNGVSQCPIDTGPAQSVLTWTYSSSGCGGFSLAINRGYTTLSTDGVTQIQGTQVTLSYPYTWYFASILAPVIPITLPSPFTVQAIVMNAP